MRTASSERLLAARRISRSREISMKWRLKRLVRPSRMDWCSRRARRFRLPKKTAATFVILLSASTFASICCMSGVWALYVKNAESVSVGSQRQAQVIFRRHADKMVAVNFGLVGLAPAYLTAAKATAGIERKPFQNMGKPIGCRGQFHHLP